jgi:CRP/FNR family transcriptional regulator
MQIHSEIERLTRFYPVLGELPTGLQYSFVESSYPVQASTGRILFDVDATIQSFIMLTQGSISVIWPGKERELLLYRVQPGGCCVISVCHLLDDTRCRARGQVETGITGVALPQSLFRQMVEQSPLFSYFIFHNFSDRLTELFELLEANIFMRLDARLAGLLVSRGTLIKTTHSQLADELGSVREVISRILKNFEIMGLVKLDRNQVQVLDEKALKKIARLR